MDKSGDDTSILYGFGGGPNENPIIGTAQSLQTYLTYRVDYKIAAQGVNMDATASALPPSLWVRSMSIMALARNVKSPSFGPIATGPEPNNENRWREMAARVLTIVASGGHIDVLRPVRPLRPNLLTPLEVEFCSELAKGIVRNKMSREEINKIVMDGLVPKYKPIYDKPPKERGPLLKGKAFEELYDLNTLKPSNEHLDSYHSARDELMKLGIKFEW